MEFKNESNARKLTGLSYLGGVNISSKLEKNMKVNNHLTYSLYLAPANTSGYNVCLFATPECKTGCLATSGRAAIDIWSGANKITNSRIKKTQLFFEKQSFFMNWLIAEITRFKKEALVNNYGFSIRLNCTSDIDWQNVKHNGLTIFEMFSDVAFYDYTKNFNKFQNKPSNYNLTFSFTGKNWTASEILLRKGHNVAVVFNVKDSKDLPETFNGYSVIDGDLSDARFLDPKGVIIGLKFKHIADRNAEKEVLNSCFVVQPTDERCYVRLKRTA